MQVSEVLVCHRGALGSHCPTDVSFLAVLPQLLSSQLKRGTPTLSSDVIAPGIAEKKQRQ